MISQLELTIVDAIMLIGIVLMLVGGHYVKKETMRLKAENKARKEAFERQIADSAKRANGSSKSQSCAKIEVDSDSTCSNDR